MSDAFSQDALTGRVYNQLDSFAVMMGGRGVDGALPGFAGSQGTGVVYV